jgi:hypothetical protein
VLVLVISSTDSPCSSSCPTSFASSPAAATATAAQHGGHRASQLRGSRRVRRDLHQDMLALVNEVDAVFKERNSALL